MRGFRNYYLLGIIILILFGFTRLSEILGLETLNDLFKVWEEARGEVTVLEDDPATVGADFVDKLLGFVSLTFT